MEEQSPGLGWSASRELEWVRRLSLSSSYLDRAHLDIRLSGISPAMCCELSTQLCTGSRRPCSRDTLRSTSTLSSQLSGREGLGACRGEGMSPERDRSRQTDSMLSMYPAERVSAVSASTRSCSPGRAQPSREEGSRQLSRREREAGRRKGSGMGGVISNLCSEVSLRSRIEKS